LASAQDERILNERRRLADHPFDVRGLRGATLAELDLTRFQLEYLPALVAPDILEANDRTLEQKLCATKMVVSEENPTPTVLGMLMVGKAPADWLPGAYTQFLRLNGTSLADAALSNLVVDDAVIRGRLPEQIERLEAKLESHNRKAVRFADVPTEVRQEDYPLEALQQLVRNAYLHRSYEATNSPTRVYWYDDRIEIWSPGGPCGTVTAANFGSPGLTDYRNPNLAEALRAMGFVQRFGAGLTLARRLLGDRLQFEVDAGFVRVIVAARRG
jgi:ATP-dependent DNA helicase RecG